MDFNRDEEDFLLDTVPDQAWNLAIAKAPKFDIVKALRNYGHVDLGLVASVKLVERMLRMLDETS